MPARTGRAWREKVKPRVLRRDGGICHLCHLAGADSVDHIVAVADGGALYDLANLAAVHHDTGYRCNRIRGARSIDEARARIEALKPQDGYGPPREWTW